MMTQHTPGPWTAKQATTGLTSVYPVGNTDRVADVYCPLYGPGTLSGNARLIAKAPEMLVFVNYVADQDDPADGLRDVACVLLREIEGETA